MSCEFCPTKHEWTKLWLHILMITSLHLVPGFYKAPWVNNCVSSLLFS